MVQSPALRGFALSTASLCKGGSRVAGGGLSAGSRWLFANLLPVTIPPSQPSASTPPFTQGRRRVCAFHGSLLRGPVASYNLPPCTRRERCPQRSAVQIGGQQIALEEDEVENPYPSKAFSFRKMAQERIHWDKSRWLLLLPIPSFGTPGAAFPTEDCTFHNFPV